jgi:hypothetical protein
MAKKTAKRATSPQHGKWEVTLKDLRALKRKVAALDEFTKDLDARLVALAKATPGVGLDLASGADRSEQADDEP